MDNTHIETSIDKDDAAFDTLARSLHGRVPRRRVAGLLVAALATGVSGVSSHAKTAEAKRKRGKRRGRRGGAEAVAATSIPPNCIYVCCDGTCDSWKMCLRCFKWPKPTTTT
ncbi:MAG: hypothetical protein KY456_13615, partial [Chloroflexi bacterium]|nr:hypothetical protein [Chloroflexota bacterium]